MPTDPPCGPNSWKSKLWGSWHAPQFVFKHACRTHDISYSLGGTAADRKHADDAFYHSMKAAIARHRGYKRPWLRFWAWVYIRAVRQQGDRFFTYTRPA